MLTRETNVNDMAAVSLFALLLAVFPTRYCKNKAN